jgi:hypothetical protein
MMLNWNKHIRGSLINMKLQLVDDWKEAKRWWSMRWIVIGAFTAGAAAAYQWLPADWLPELPAMVKKYLALGAVVSMGMAGVSRVIKQPKKEDQQ